MKVKITKTIDLHQIPDEARRMLDNLKSGVINSLPESINQVAMRSFSSRGEEFFQTIELIDSFRKHLAALDESAQEIQNIISGYKKAVMPEPEPPEEDTSDQEWLYRREAEYEKLMSQIDGTDEVTEEEDADEVENEEG
jgi:hypothetical protein